jgi:aminopeptidase N
LTSSLPAFGSRTELVEPSLDCLVPTQASVGLPVQLLAEIGDVRSRSALERALDRELDGRVRRRIRELLRDLGARGRAELRRLRDELSELERRHAELAAKVAKLAAGRTRRGERDEAAKRGARRRRAPRR